MDLFPRSVTAPVSRIGAAAQNALEVARFGGLATDEQPSPHEVISEQPVYRLRRYFPGSSLPDAPPVLLVPPMMLAAEVYDVSERTSAVRTLHAHGIDPWVVDFGAPERERGGLERTLADHVLAVSDAVTRVGAHTGRAVNLGGYSQGGMFCYQAAAYLRNGGLSSLITFGSPVDARTGVPFGLPEQLAGSMAALLARRLRGVALPAWASRTGFALLDPGKSLRNRLDFILRLHDREALLAREGQRRFLEADGWVAWPGPALADFLQQFVVHNRMLEGGFVIDERLVTLADIACPILAVVGTVDQIAPAAGVRAIRRAAPRAEIYELALPAGHFGLVVGSLANDICWPTVAAWARWRAGLSGRPARLVPMAEPDDPPVREAAPAVASRLGYGLSLAGGVGGGIVRSAAAVARRSARGALEIAHESAHALPRLARLEQIQPGTRISLGLLVAERGRRAPDETLFLYEDRAYSAREINQRIDNVVRGLLHIGVRQGEHIGVLMAPRPSALVLAIALSRLGAVAVMLRPDGELARETRLGQVTRVICDPERAAQAAALGSLATFVLGGSGGPRDIGVPKATDMERIDPLKVELPRWYRPNPGRASELAFVLFSGDGEGTRVSRITNRRWALSAFGTASSAALKSADTVYSVTPLYHASGLMMSVGGAVAGGARLAMARGFDPQTYWEEVRRYGVTVAAYTWTLLRELVEAPPHPGERHHPLRLFIGSGMPKGLWRRVLRRFSPARVLEFYASTEAGAILANLATAKAGAMGRPLPGAAEVRVAAFDVRRDALMLDRDGFARRCRTDEVGMLMARVSPAEQTSTVPLRSVFASGDAWVMTGDLFRCDSEGDFWRIDSLADVIRTSDGVVLPGVIRDALEELSAVDLAVAYGVPVDGGASEIAVAAVTLRRGARLSAAELTAALSGLERNQRPQVVRVVKQIPVTTWYRPMTAPLRAAGLPAASAAASAWALDGKRDAYVPLSARVRRRSAARPGDSGRDGRFDPSAPGTRT
jgi:putative long chain acyl-CoA synthase